MMSATLSNSSQSAFAIIRIVRKSSEIERNENDIITGRNRKVQTRTVVLSNVNVPSTVGPRAIAADEYTFAGRILSRQLFVDGTPEVNEAGGELVGKSRQERFDRTQKAKD